MRRSILALFSVFFLVAATTLVWATSPPQKAAAQTADPVITAAGDIACEPPGTRTANLCHQGDTQAHPSQAGTDDLLGGATMVLPLGDEQYQCGQLSAFNAAYHQSWGDFRGISRPVVGDNEYAGSTCTTPGAEGYFTYFGDRASPDQPGCTVNCKGYYSYNLGSWHLVALNSECTQPGVGGCGGTSPQVQWLKADLATNQSQCTLAYFHRPYWRDNGGTVARMRPFVNALHADRGELILVGHEHLYARFAKQHPTTGAVSATGVRQFTVGTGGRSLGALASPAPANVQDRERAYGVLKLTLHPTSYSWQFVADTGVVLDSGTQACH